MEHLQPFSARDQFVLPMAESTGWRLKRYVITADGKRLDHGICSAALSSAIEKLPKPGKLTDDDSNHGVGFQIIHFAQVAVVSPVFYWQWGSVLANIDQLRAPWINPTQFSTGVKEVVGCIWEMQIVSFEIQAWTNTVLSGNGIHEERLQRYLEQCLPTAELHS